MNKEIRSYETLANKKLPSYYKSSYKQRVKYLANQKQRAKSDNLIYEFKQSEIAKDKIQFNYWKERIQKERLESKIEKIKNVDKAYYHEVMEYRSRKKGDLVKAQEHKLELSKLQNKSRDTIRRAEKKLFDLKAGKEKPYKNQFGTVLTKQEVKEFKDLVKRTNAKRNTVLRSLKKSNEMDYNLIVHGLEGLNGRANISKGGFNVLTSRNYYKTSEIESREDFEEKILEMEKFLNADDYIKSNQNDDAKRIFNKIDASAMNRVMTYEEAQELKEMINNLSISEMHIFTQRFWENAKKFDSGADETRELGVDFESYFEKSNAENLIKIVKNDVEHFYTKRRI